MLHCILFPVCMGFVIFQPTNLGDSTSPMHHRGNRAAPRLMKINLESRALLFVTAINPRARQPAGIGLSNLDRKTPSDHVSSFATLIIEKAVQPVTTATREICAKMAGGS